MSRPIYSTKIGYVHYRLTIEDWLTFYLSWKQNFLKVSFHKLTNGVFLKLYLTQKYVIYIFRRAVVHVVYIFIRSYSKCGG